MAVARHALAAESRWLPVIRRCCRPTMDAVAAIEAGQIFGERVRGGV